MFTGKSTFHELLEYPGMDRYKKFFFDFPIEGNTEQSIFEAEKMEEVSFEKMAESVSPAWNADSMADGLNWLAVFNDKDCELEIPVYSKEEIEKDSSKERVGLLCFPVKKKGPFAVVCAGGSYMNVANIAEAFPTAKRLNELGITAFVLQYRAGAKNAAPRSLEDLHRTVSYILAHKTQLNVTDKYSVFGFSAGGHLAAEFGTSNLGYSAAKLPKPDMLCLCYPLVDLAQENQQIAQITDIMFDMRNKQEMIDEYTPIKHLDESYPKTYIWQTVEDEIIPYEKNGLAFYKRLLELQVPAKLKEVPHGLHGLGIGKGSEAEGWLEEAVAFWKS